MAISDVLSDLTDAVTDEIVEHPGRVLTTWVVLYLLSVFLAAQEQDSGETDYHGINVNQIEAEQKREKEALEKELQKRQGMSVQLRTSKDYLDETGRILEKLKQQPRLDQMGNPFSQAMAQLEAQHSYLQTAALSDSGTVFANAVMLYNEALSLEQEYQTFSGHWNHAMEEWRSWWKRVDQLIRDNRTVRLPLNTAAGLQTVEFVCDDWCDGALARAALELKPLEQPENVTIDTLVALSEETARLAERVRGIIRTASYNYLDAQFRIQTSLVVLQALERRGWYLEQESDHAFQTAGNANAMRNPLELHLVNPAGDRLEFLFSPGAQTGGEGTSTIRMQLKAKGVHNRDLQRQLAQVVETALRGSGVTIQSQT